MGRLNLSKIALYEIGNLLQANEKIRKLLIYDTTDCLSITTPPTFSDADDYVIKKPVSDINIAPYNKNTLISLAYTNLVLQDSNKFSNILKINVISKLDL